MKIKLHNLYSKVENATEEERNWLFKYLSFSDASSRYKYGNKGKDKKIRLFNRFQNSFPSGLYGLVRRGVIRTGFDLDLVDQRAVPVQRDPAADLSWLRWYQTEAVDTAFEETRGIIQAPTGSGKGEIVVALAKAAPCLWLFLVHRKGLVDDIAERYERRTGTPAVHYSTDMQIPQTGFVVSTFQSFVAALRKSEPVAERLMFRVGGIIVDECHIQAADSFYKITMNTPNAYYRFGLSGTPLARGDRRSVKAVAALGPVIYRIKASTLIEEGVLAVPDITMIPVEQYSTKPTYQGIYGELVVRSATRHRAIIDATKQAAKPCMVFVKQINHGEELKKRLLRENLNVNFVSGQESAQKRKRLKTQLERGELDVLIASVVFQEGVDIPNLESVVLAHGGKSIIATLQRIGRGMRTDQGKKFTFQVWDIYDCGCSMLLKHSKTRQKAYEREGYEVKMHPTTYRKEPKK